MTPEEAIDIVKCTTGEVRWSYPIDYAEAIEVAIEALEKQIAKSHNMLIQDLGITEEK